MITEATAKKLLSELPDVSRETMDKLDIFHGLLAKWTASINLISKPTRDQIWSRHILDSAQIWQHKPSKHKIWVDIGTGGGFPGLILAIMAEDDTEFHFVESDARKCAFLRNASREVGVSVTVHTQRIESMSGLCADVVSARALATVDKLLTLTTDILADDGVCMFQKGAACDIEIEEAQNNWAFLYDIKPSITSNEGALLTIKDIQRA